jgi:alcohol dehydrogenase
MNALVYRGPGQPSWESHAKPAIIQPGDAIVRITTTTICGSDLHILKGDVPTVTEGHIPGHEAIGVIDAAGPAVSAFRKADRVVK